MESIRWHGPNVFGFTLIWVAIVCSVEYTPNTAAITWMLIDSLTPVIIVPMIEYINEWLFLSDEEREEMASSMDDFIYGGPIR